jgi:hypothetical protein
METDFTPRLEDWLATKESNERLIVTNKMQILMAEEVLKLIDKKIKICEKLEKLLFKRKKKVPAPTNSGEIRISAKTH